MHPAPGRNRTAGAVATHTYQGCTSAYRQQDVAIHFGHEAMQGVHAVNGIILRGVAHHDQARPEACGRAVSLNGQQ